jgi:hypothetical protein
MAPQWLQRSGASATLALFLALALLVPAESLPNLVNEWLRGGMLTPLYAAHIW